MREFAIDLISHLPFHPHPEAPEIIRSLIAR
jgi:hypothetical protein